MKKQKVKDESTHASLLRRARKQKAARKLAKDQQYMKIIHEWVADRDIHEPHIVLRIDDYCMNPEQRGQFYPVNERRDDNQKAIWPNRELAIAAARWAVKQFGHQYGVFKMTTIVETAVVPVKEWEL